jgi:hypothetical protein
MFYEVWRDGEKIAVTMQPGVDVALMEGDELVEYQLNKVLKVQDFRTYAIVGLPREEEE